MGKKETEAKEKEASKVEAEENKKVEADGEGGEEKPHDDADQDKELIKKMIAEYVGDGMDEGMVQEMEGLAKEAFDAHKEMGADEKEAYERAGHALKLAKHMASKQMDEAAKKEAEETKESEETKEAGECKEGEDKDADAEKDEEKKEESKSKEAARVKELEKKLMEATGENAALKAKLSNVDVEKYVETKLSESKQPRAVTKKFREAAGTIKSTADFDAKWALFCEGIKNSQVKLDWGVLSEKATTFSESEKTKGRKSKSLDFSQVAED